MGNGVLSDVRVLDLGRFIAAPYCGMLLADMGAEVIRVERPGGEDDRTVGLKGDNGENFTFAGLARNKKGVTLDLRNSEARNVLVDLVKQSDVFLHNFGLPAVKTLNITYQDIRKIKADIIYTAISCYGADGPHADRTGFDPIAQVGSGAAAVTGTPELPMRSGVPWVDYGTGLFAAFGTMLALRHRDVSGQGQAVDCALLQTAVSFTAPMIAEALVAGRERPRLSNRVPYLGPADLYRCRNGYVYLIAATEGMWRSLMKLIGRPDLIEMPDLRSDEQRFERRADIDPLVEAWIVERDVEEVVKAMELARIPCGIYRRTSDVPNDPQVRARRMLEYLDLEVPGLNHVPVTGIPLGLSSTPGSIVSRPPRIGEHNGEVYGRMLGYSEERITAMSMKGLI